VSNVISAQKAEDGNFSWVEFTPRYHSHLVKCAVALVPHPVHAVKRVMFVYVLELLNGVGDQDFFDLRTGGRKANNAQHEKKRLARKRRRAAKREWDREAAKAAQLPKPAQSCSQCGRGFKSRKTARKHKCPVSKVESVREEAAVVPAAQVAPPALPNKLAALITPRAPPAPSNSDPQPTVTGDLWTFTLPPSLRNASHVRMIRGLEGHFVDQRVQGWEIIAEMLWRNGWRFSAR
jgi:predicted Zn-ribbon and HTH transcriptional regulator